MFTHRFAPFVPRKKKEQSDGCKTQNGKTKGNCNAQQEGLMTHGIIKRNNIRFKKWSHKQKLTKKCGLIYY